MTTYTEAEYESLRQAYAEGVLTVQYGDKRTTYRSRADMARILADMETALGKRESAPRFSFAGFSKPT